MSEDLLIRHCSPTCRDQDGKSLFLRLLQPGGADERPVPTEQELVPRGIRVLPLRFAKGAL